MMSNQIWKNFISCIKNNYTKIKSDGSISVEKPLSKAGDKVVLKALMDVHIGIATCSVSESDCNGGKCSSIKIIVGE